MADDDWGFGGNTGAELMKVDVIPPLPITPPTTMVERDQQQRLQFDAGVARALSLTPKRSSNEEKERRHRKEEKSTHPQEIVALSYKCARDYMKQFAMWPPLQKRLALQHVWLTNKTNVGMRYRYYHTSSESVNAKQMKSISAVSHVGYEMGARDAFPGAKLITAKVMLCGIQVVAPIRWSDDNDDDNADFYIEENAYSHSGSWKVDTLRLANDDELLFPSAFYGIVPELFGRTKLVHTQPTGVDIGEWCSYRVIDHFMEIISVLYDAMNMRSPAYGPWTILRGYLYDEPIVDTPAHIVSVTAN